MMFFNTIIPGYAQLKLGQTGDALFYMLTAIPLNIAANGLLVYYMLHDIRGFLYRLTAYENKHYFISPEVLERLSSIEWMLNTGIILSTWSSLLYSYSSCSGHRNYMDLYAENTSVQANMD